LENSRNVVLLVGGVGGAKLAYGLAQLVAPERLTIIVNTGDDFWHYGLRICPDLDTIMYTLSGLVNTTMGWGVADDTTVTLEALTALGETPWFKLGDKDLATHLRRTQLWDEGHTLTHITNQLTQSVGIPCNILPMTDAPVATMVDTVEHGELGFQVYFVKHRWQPTLKSLRFAGIEDANISSEVEEAIQQADVLIIGPSNPWLSIDPILSVPGMRERIASRQIPRLAVTPVIDGEAVKGPTAKLMRELGHEVSPKVIANFYGDVINAFVYDQRDQSVQMDHLMTTAFDTLMIDNQKRVELAQYLLDWTEKVKTP